MNEPKELETGGSTEDGGYLLVDDFDMDAIDDDDIDDDDAPMVKALFVKRQQ
jgi:hypothetical protein